MVGTDELARCSLQWDKANRLEFAAAAGTIAAVEEDFCDTLVS
jgi:hypothetical protein